MITLLDDRTETDARVTEPQEELWQLYKLLRYDSHISCPGICLALLAPLATVGADWQYGDTPPEHVLATRETQELGAYGLGLRSGDIFRAIAAPLGEHFKTAVRPEERGVSLTTFIEPLDYGTGDMVRLSGVLRIEHGGSWKRRPAG